MDQRKYEEARRRVKQKKEFYSHLTTFIIMSGFFFLLNAATSMGNWWFHWPVLGWGIGVAFHYFDTFGLVGVGALDQRWEEESIERELRKIDGYLDPPKQQDEDTLDLPPLPKKNPQKRWDDQDLV